MLFLSSNCLAGEAFIAYGLGVFNSAKYSPTETKMINGGYRAEIYDGLYCQFKGGYWSDMSGDPGRRDSLYGSVGPGLEISLNPVEIRSGWSLGMISTPDKYLGGIFPQFNGELYVGVRDKKNDGVGVKYEHISSAGIVTPNFGRDFVTLELSIKW